MVYLFNSLNSSNIAGSDSEINSAKKSKGKANSKSNKECEDVTNDQNTMFKTQKRRRRSLDESLINPFKAFVAGNRNRRQSTTDAVSFQRGALFYNSDRRRKQSENDLFARLQDTTKERIRTAVTKSTSFKDSDSGVVRKNTPTMLRRISRHLIRAYNDNENRNSITELPNESDDVPSVESPKLQRLGKNFDKNCDTSSLSTNDSGIDSRDDKTISSDEGDFDSVVTDKSKNDKTNMGRSISFDNIAGEEAADKTDSSKKSVRRQFSLREEHSKEASKTVMPSPVVLRKSLEKLNNISLQKASGHCSSDEKIQQNSNNKGGRKKKKISLQPLVNKIRKVSRNETTQQQQKLLMIDNARLEQIVSEIIHDKMQNLEYDHKQSNDRCRSISTGIENTLKLRLGSQPGNPEYKIIALVYIGETRDQGICFATQCSFEPAQDLFATATFQRESMYVCATVMASLINK